MMFVGFYQSCSHVQLTEFVPTGVIFIVFRVLLFCHMSISRIVL